MPLYQYESFTRLGKKVSGSVDASSLQMAKEILRGQGLMPISITEASVEAKKFTFKSLFEKKVDLRTKVVFTKQLSVLLRSGVPLLKAIELLTDQFEGRFRRILIDVKDGLKSGGTLADQLAKYPKVFSNVYVQLVKAGEASGKLENILKRLTGYLEREEETRKKIKKAISYPIFVLFFVALVVVALLTVLVPRMTGMFKKMNKELPFATKLLMNFSDIFINHFLLIFIFFGGILFAFLYWRSTTSGKLKLDEIFLRFPITSYFSRTKAVAQFSKTLGMLLESGVNLSQALDIVCNIVENKVLVVKLRKARDNIIKEGKIAKYLAKTEIFPAIATYMIRTGEQSGKLDKMLLTVGSDYEEELSELIDSLTEKIGPAMTIIMGLIVAFVMLAIFLPVMQMGDITGI